MMKIYALRIFLAMFIFGLLGGCTTPAVIQKADPLAEYKAKIFDVDASKSKIYFVNGKVTPNMFNMDHSYPSDFYVNDIAIGSMNKDNAMVVDLIPGSYDFHWLPRSTDLIDKNSLPQKFKIKAEGGQVIVLRGDYSLGGAAYFGLIGSLASPPKTSITVASKEDISNKVIVLPQNCNTTFCSK